MFINETKTKTSVNSTFLTQRSFLQSPKTPSLPSSTVPDQASLSTRQERWESRQFNQMNVLKQLSQTSNRSTQSVNDFHTAYRNSSLLGSLQQNFKALDRDQDGILNKKELMKADALFKQAEDKKTLAQVAGLERSLMFASKDSSNSSASLGLSMKDLESVQNRVKGGETLENVAASLRNGQSSYSKELESFNRDVDMDRMLFHDFVTEPDNKTAKANKEENFSPLKPLELHQNQLLSQQRRRSGNIDPAKVKHVQEMMKAQGGKLDIDGKFGPSTEKAVREFQKKNGLKVDGIVGPQTMAALNKLLSQN